MADLSLDSVFVVCVAGALAPLLLGLSPRLRLPAVVLEIIAGIVLGPSVLGWIEIDAPVQVLSMIGLSFLLFLSGLEIDVRRLRGRVLRLAVLGYLITLALGVPIGLGVEAAGWVGSATLLVVILSATSLGLVVPVLKDTGNAGDTVGQAAIVSASVADISAIVLLSLLFSTSDGSAESRLLLVAAFVTLVAVTGVVVSQAGRWMRLSDVLLRLQDTTAEIRVRLAVVLLIGFTALAQEFGLESILGAFLAGAVISVVDRDSSSHLNFRTKLNAIGFGFPVPVFFVTSGASLQVEGLIDSPAALARVPVFLAALLLMRGLPGALYIGLLGRRPAIALGLLNATSLPFIVAAAQIGMELGSLSRTTGAALVSAGLLSVLFFPLAALSLLGGDKGTSVPGSPERNTWATPTM